MPTDNALHKAANSGDMELLLMLLSVPTDSEDSDEQLDVNSAGAGDRRPIHRAAGANHVDAVKLLIEKGASVDQVILSYKYLISQPLIGSIKRTN